MAWKLKKYILQNILQGFWALLTIFKHCYYFDHNCIRTYILCLRSLALSLVFPLYAYMTVWLSARGKVLESLICSRHMHAKPALLCLWLCLWLCVWPLQNLLYQNCSTTNGRTASPSGKGHHCTLTKSNQKHILINIMCQNMKSCYWDKNFEGFFCSK